MDCVRNSDHPWWISLAVTPTILLLALGIKTLQVVFRFIPIRLEDGGETFMENNDTLTTDLESQIPPAYVENRYRWSEDAEVEKGKDSDNDYDDGYSDDGEYNESYGERCSNSQQAKRRYQPATCARKVSLVVSNGNVYCSAADETINSSSQPGIHLVSSEGEPGKFDKSIITVEEAQNDGRAAAQCRILQPNQFRMWSEGPPARKLSNAMRASFTSSDGTPADGGGFYGKVISWMHQNRIGLSAQQQLKMKVSCEKYTTLSYPAGKVMLTIYVLLNTTSWLLYIVETYDTPPISIEGVCLTRKMRILAWVNVPINLFCIVYYILRLLAATDRVSFVLSVSSLIDVIVVPPSLLNALQRYRHIDFNFLRSACIFKYVDILMFMGVITSNRSIQSARISFALFTMWMVGSGIMHVVDHLGDFWSEEPQSGEWTYFEASYFLLVTLSTVGYGDYTTRSTLGKLFICIFIPVAMGVSASFIPELFRNFNTNNNVSSGRYEAILGERHVLVCGNFTNNSLRAFLKGFLYVGRCEGKVAPNIVILKLTPIDLALKAILSHYHAWVKYFVGTPTNLHDLARVKIKTARAAIVLAAPNSTGCDTEDGANIIQAIALKARQKSLRVVLQLHNYRNKCLLNNFPRWTNLRDDLVVCMEELKLGLLAYNCLAPGFATLILNLLNIHGTKRRMPRENESWRQEYDYGFCMELHDVGISHEFENLIVRDLATFVYMKWNMILVAIRCTDTEETPMVINPSELNFLIRYGKMRAIVICSDRSTALKLQYYCITCYGHIRHQPCRCRKVRRNPPQKVKVERDLALYEQIVQSWRIQKTEQLSKRKELQSTLQSCLAASSHSPLERPSVINTLTITSSKDLQNLLKLLNNRSLNRTRTEKSLENSNVTGRNHQCSSEIETPEIRLSVTNEDEEYQIPKMETLVDRTGSFHWVPDRNLRDVILTPSQASSFNFQNHILLCVVGRPSNGPLNLETFIMPLRFHWKEVMDIVVLGNSDLITKHDWIQLKNLPRIYIVNGNPCSFTDLYAVQLCRCTACVILSDDEEQPDEVNPMDICLLDRKTLLCAMNIRSLLQREHRAVHLTTELKYERNAHLFSTVDIDENDYNLPVWFSEPFAGGFLFSNTLLYSCMSSFYYNDDVFYFLRVLISGQSAEELENSFAICVGLQASSAGQEKRNRGVNLALRGFNQPPFSFMSKENRRAPLQFKEVFLRCLNCWQILCLGLYRRGSRGFRYVVANPRPETILRSDDMFYCFMPVNPSDEWDFGSQLPLCESSP